jgi:hypothetical protein
MSSTVTVLGRQPPTNEAILIGNAELEQPAEGWDTLKEKLWLPDPYWLRRGTLRDGPGPEQGIFIVQDMRTVEWYAGRPVVEVISRGIASEAGKDYKLECSGSLNEDISLASGVYLSPTLWRLGYPRVTKLWVSLTTPAIYAHVGVASVPPDTFGIGGSGWAMSWIAEDNWLAAGWIGESRTPQQLPGSTACLVTDTWLFDVGYADRDGVVPGVIYL